MATTVRERLDALKAAGEGAGGVEQAAIPSIGNVRERLDAMREKMNAPPPPVDYSDAKEIGSLKMSGVPILNQIKASGGLLLDARPEAQVNILQKNIPGIEADFDDEGVPFVRYRGQEYYLNKPGLSFADVTQFLGDAAAFLPASKAAGLGKTALQRFGVGAATYGATSAGMDVAGNLMGSEQGIDPIKAGVSAVLGGAAEAVTPYVIQGVRRLVGSRKLYRPGEGLTDRGKAMVKDLGFDPEVFSEAAARQFAEMIGGKVDPATAATAAESRAFNIRTTRGEATQDFNLLQREDLARKGGYGDRAQRLMQEFDDAKTSDMLSAADQMRQRLSQQGIGSEVEGAGVVSEGLRARSAAQKRAVQSAYDEAAQYDARIDSGAIRDFAKGVSREVRDGNTLIDKTLTPSTIRALDEVDGLAKGKGVTAITLKNLEGTRRKLNQMIEAAVNPADRRNVIAIKSKLDDFVDDAFDRALFEGDDQALAAMKNARDARKKYGDLFQSRGKGDVAGDAINRIIEFDADENQALSYLFGRSRLGGKDSANKIAVRTREVLGKDSREWQAFKETAFLRLLKGALRENVGKQSFNGQAFVRNFDQAMKEAPALMKTIFEDALPHMKGFRNAVDRASYRPPGSVNVSGTGVAISRMAQDSFGKLATAMGLSGDATMFALLKGASVLSKNVGRNYAKELKPALPKSAFASALLAATGPGAIRSLSPQPSANSRSEPGSR